MLRWLLPGASTKMDIIHYTVLGLLVAACTGAKLAPSADRARLQHDLFSDYDKTVAPSGENGTIRISHSIMAASVVSLENDVLELTVWTLMMWKDERLRWDPAEYGNTTKLSLPSSMVWVPDIAILQSIESYNGYSNRDINALIYPKGDMTFVPSDLVKASCPFDPDALYVDNTVHCELKFMSWTLDCDSLDLQPQWETSTDNYLNSPDNKWNITLIHAVRTEKVYSCCPEAYCDIAYTFDIARVA